MRQARARAVGRALVLAAAACGAGAAAAREAGEQWWGPGPVPLSMTPFFNDGALRPQTMIAGGEHDAYYDAGDHEVEAAGDSVSRHADGAQPVRRVGTYACPATCGAASPGAGAGYLTGVDPGALHAAADAWHLDAHRADTSTGGSAYAVAAVGDMLHLDHAATVHLRGDLEGTVLASGEHSQAAARFDLLVLDPASVRLDGDGMLVDLRGGYTYDLHDTGSGPTAVVDPPIGPLPRHGYDLAIDLPAGDSFVSIQLASSALAWESGAQSDFGDTATFTLIAPADAHARFASGLIPLATSAVPEPAGATLAGGGLLLGLPARRRRGRTDAGGPGGARGRLQPRSA
jgi:hypothetical protein